LHDYHSSGLGGDRAHAGCASAAVVVPLTLASLPGFADLLSSVNNDVGAVAFVSLVLWGSLRLIQRGLMPLDLT